VKLRYADILYSVVFSEVQNVSFCVCSALEDMEIEFDKNIKPNVLVFFDGTCRWFPPGRFSLPCPIDISWFPFDEQTCSLTFQSWLYDGLKLNLTLAIDKVEINIANGEWDLLGKYTLFTRVRRTPM